MYDKRFHEQAVQVMTIRVSEELNVDLALDGTIYGLELLNANRQLGNLAKEKLVVENAATGSKTEVSWPT